MITCCKKLFIFYSTADQYAYWWVVLHSTYIITFNKIYICMIGCMYRTCMMYTCSTCSSLLFHHIFFFFDSNYTIVTQSTSVCCYWSKRSIRCQSTFKAFTTIVLLFCFLLFCWRMLYFIQIRQRFGVVRFVVFSICETKKKKKRNKEQEKQTWSTDSKRDQKKKKRHKLQQANAQ